MWAIVLLIVAIGAGEKAKAGRVVREVFYTKHPVDDHHPDEEVYVKAPVAVVPVSPKFLDEHAPAYYHPDMKLEEDLYDSDVMKKSAHDVEESAVKAVKEDEGKQHVMTDVVGKHGYDEGAHASKSTAEEKVLSEKSKEYDTSSKNGHGEHGNTGFKKSHKTTGFHKSYYKEESGKDHQYVDEDHKSGEKNFGKQNDEHFGEAGRERYAIANGGAGYRYSSAGSGDHGSGLRSATAYDSMYGHHGRLGSHYDRDAALRNELAAAYLRGIHAGRHNVGRYEPIY